MTKDTLLEVLEKWWDANGLMPDKIFEEDERYGFQDLYIGEAGRYKIFFDINIKHQTIALYFVPIIKLPKEHQANVIEFVTRVNYGIRLGNWEFDLVDHEIRFKTSMSYKDTMLEEQDLSNMYQTGLKSVEQYLPGLNAVLEGKEPWKAIVSCEYK